MSITKAQIQSMFANARSIFEGANVTMRYKGREYVGTRTPKDVAEMVDEAGAMFTVTGGARFTTADFSNVYPRSGEQIQIYASDRQRWLTYTIVGIRLDEMEAMMMLSYGERYDEYGVT